MQCTEEFGGFHAAGSESPFDRLLEADTAINCAMLRSLANCSRFAVVQVLAPDFHASASGTMWSMSTSASSYTHLASYTLYHLPAVGSQLLSTVTPVPSRLSTSSRVSQVPDTVCQCGNLSRLYPLVEPSVLTVRLANWVAAVLADGGVGGYACAACPGVRAQAVVSATTEVAHAVIRRISQASESWAGRVP